MPHFAEINPQTNEVLRVVGAKSKLWCENEFGGTWFRTYSDKEDKTYAGLGCTYHPEKENFSAPQPFPSWTLDDQCNWVPPAGFKPSLHLYVEADFAGAYNFHQLDGNVQIIQDNN